VTDLNPEQVRRIRQRAYDLTLPPRYDHDSWGGGAKHVPQLKAESVLALCDSWLAQGEALAAAQEALRDAIDGAMAALASLSNTDSGSEATTAGRDTPNKPGDLAGGVVARTPRTKGTE
jgi:hypothetical protein